MQLRMQVAEIVSRVVVVVDDNGKKREETHTTVRLVDEPRRGELNFTLEDQSCWARTGEYYNVTIEV